MCDQAKLEKVGGTEFYRCKYDGTPCHCQANENNCIKRDCR